MNLEDVQMGLLDGKVALVTGGARGLGEAIARRMVIEGATVVAADRRVEDGEKVAAEIGASFRELDVTDASAWQTCVAEIVALHQRLDVLVNNAGISGYEGNEEKSQRRMDRSLQQVAELGAGGPVRTHTDATIDTTDEEWHRMIGVHLDGTFFCSREALRIMGPQMSGVIVNMGSIMGTTGGGGSGPYSAAKAGIMGLTRAMARECVTRNIRVNAIAPGFFLTEQNRALLTKEDGSLTERSNKILSHTPMRRFGVPEDLPGTLLWLLDDRTSGFVTGTVVPVDGGFMAYSGV
jgi:NAD(P)-dependent dehydrogenase (short-subunit alcohol dehydrogenase family)